MKKSPLNKEVIHIKKNVIVFIDVAFFRNSYIQKGLVSLFEMHHKIQVGDKYLTPSRSITMFNITNNGIVNITDGSSRNFDGDYWSDLFFTRQLLS